MANLIEYIQSQVYENSTEDISGSIMQQVLTRMASDEGVVNVHTISGQTPFADYNNAQAARDAVPAGFKKLGLIITYKLSSGWYIDEFIGSATSGWSTASNWKCLGPISVSQNASTGKTTITIGSESFDVATQPVSVSQNTSTNNIDIAIGDETNSVASAAEFSSSLGKAQLNLQVTPGVIYGFAATKIPVIIHSGDKFNVLIQTDGSIDPPMLEALYKGDSTVTYIQRVSLNQNTEITASDDIEALGFYIGSSDIHTGGSFVVTISLPSGIMPRLAALETNQQEIEDIVPKANVIELGENLFDRDKVIINKYYAGDAQTPTLADNTNFGCYLVEIPDDEANYILKYKDFQVDAYNATLQRISTVYFTAGVAHSVPAGTKYLTISVTKEHINSQMVVMGDELPSSFVTFGNELKNERKKVKEYHVGVNIDSTDYFPYHSLTALLKELQGDEDEKIIYLHGGTYDIFAEYGGEDYIATLTGNENWRDVSVIVPNNTKIIGCGLVILKFTPTEEQIVSSNIAKLFSPLNVSGNCHIENITIVAENCRYCVHDEVTEGVSANSRHIYKNVNMVKRQGIDGNPQAFGCGFGKSMYYEFDGCDISSYTMAFSMHNDDTATSSKRSHIVIKNCHIHSTGVTDTPLVFRNSSTIQVEHLVEIYNTYIKGSENYVILKIENPSGNTSVVNCFNVTMIGCNDVTPSIVGITPPNLYEVKQFNTAGVVFYNKKLIFNSGGSVTWEAIN